MPETLRELSVNIDRLTDAVVAALKTVARETARTVQGRAQQLVPKKTGDTMRAIVVIDESEDQRYVVTVNNPKKPNLGLWLERGTVHMAARPFMRPAADEAEPSYRANMIAAAERIAEDLLT